MFDVGFSELMVIAAVALVVVGPERLPAVARTVGALLGRAQRYANALKSDIQNEIDMEEFKRIEATFYDATQSIEHSVEQARAELDATAASLNRDLVALAQMPSAVSAEEPRAMAQMPSAVSAEEPSAMAQMELWRDAAPVAGPATGPGTVAPP